MEQKVLNFIRNKNLINSGDSIIVGVSGGPDSICLLNILKNIKSKKLDFKIFVAHINHMIRKEAQLDQQYVQQYCKKFNIECFVKKVDVLKIAKKQKIGTEQAGRNIRYKFFNEIMKKTNSNKIATAHNSNDLAETVIMNILRGSGTTGLKGIEAKNNNIIRPLLICNRSEIETYCIENKLEPRIDKTNEDNIYTRNKIRNIIIPYVEKEFNPNFINTINRLANIANDEVKYFEKIVSSMYKSIIIEENKKQIILDLKEFNKLEKVIKGKLIIYTISRLIGTNQGIEKIHIQDIIKLCDNNIGNKFLLPNKKYKVLVKNKKIFFLLNTNLP